MQKFVVTIAISILLSLSSCGSARSVASGDVDERLSVKNVIRNHEAGELNFNTLSGRLAIDYSDGEASQSVTVTLRIKKDEVIWLSAPLGVIKVLITPGRVSFYNKLSNEYFDGDYSYLSQILGSDVDFIKLQNLLLGKSLMELQGRSYNLRYAAEAYELQPKTAMDLYKFLVKIEPQFFRIASQELSQPELKRIMEVRYQKYQKIQGQFLPEVVQIDAIESNQKITIGIDYKQVELNRELRFPFKIPKGYNPVALH
jgi:outer membrane biogenesis lipoprotein LolB